MPIICFMVRENHKMVREKSGNFVRAHGWTPCLRIAPNKSSLTYLQLKNVPRTARPATSCPSPSARLSPPWWWSCSSRTWSAAAATRVDTSQCEEVPVMDAAHTWQQGTTNHCRVLIYSFANGEIHGVMRKRCHSSVSARSCVSFMLANQSVGVKEMKHVCYRTKIIFL